MKEAPAVSWPHHLHSRAQHHFTTHEMEVRRDRVILRCHHWCNWTERNLKWTLATTAFRFVFVLFLRCAACCKIYTHHFYVHLFEYTTQHTKTQTTIYFAALPQNLIFISNSMKPIPLFRRSFPIRLFNAKEMKKNEIQTRNQVKRKREMIHHNLHSISINIDLEAVNYIISGFVFSNVWACARANYENNSTQSIYDNPFMLCKWIFMHTKWQSKSQFLIKLFIRKAFLLVVSHIKKGKLKVEKRTIIHSVCYGSNSVGILLPTRRKKKSMSQSYINQQSIITMKSHTHKPFHGIR